MVISNGSSTRAMITSKSNQPPPIMMTETTIMQIFPSKDPKKKEKKLPKSVSEKGFKAATNSLVQIKHGFAQKLMKTGTYRRRVRQ